MYTYILFGTWSICVLATLIAGAGTAILLIQDEPLRYYEKACKCCIYLLIIASVTLIFGSILFIIGGIKGWL